MVVTWDPLQSKHKWIMHEEEGIKRGGGRGYVWPLLRPLISTAGRMDALPQGSLDKVLVFRPARRDLPRAVLLPAAAELGRGFYSRISIRHQLLNSTVCGPLSVDLMRGWGLGLVQYSPSLHTVCGQWGRGTHPAASIGLALPVVALLRLGQSCGCALWACPLPVSACTE